MRPQLLLFLNRLRCIQLEVDSQPDLCVSVRRIDLEKDLILLESDSNEAVTKEKWLVICGQYVVRSDCRRSVCNRLDSQEADKTEVKLAFPVDELLKEGKLPVVCQSECTVLCLLNLWNIFFECCFVD